MIVQDFGSPVSALAFMPDGTLVAGLKDGRVLALTPFGDVRELLRATEPIVALTAAIAASTGALHRLAEPRLAVGREGLRALAEAGPSLVAVGAEGGFELRSLDTLQPREPRFREPHGVRAVASLGERLVAWSTGQRKIMIWDPRRADTATIPLKHTAHDLAFHPDGHQLAVAQEWSVALVDVAKKYTIRLFEKHAGRVSCVGFLDGGARLASAGWDSHVRFWNVGNGSALSAFHAPIGRILSMAIDEMNQRLAAGGDSGTLAIWDLE